MFYKPTRVYVESSNMPWRRTSVALGLAYCVVVLSHVPIHSAFMKCPAIPNHRTDPLENLSQFPQSRDIAKIQIGPARLGDRPVSNNIRRQCFPGELREVDGRNSPTCRFPIHDQECFARIVDSNACIPQGEVSGDKSSGHFAQNCSMRPRCISRKSQWDAIP